MSVKHIKKDTIYKKVLKSLKDASSLTDLRYLDFKKDKNIYKAISKIYVVVEDLYGIKLTSSQVISIFEMFKGNSVELRTGEGKSFVIACAALLFALTGRKVHLITANNILSKRDFNTYKKLFDYFNVNSAYFEYEYPFEEKEIIFNNNDIIFGSQYSFVFEYLLSEVHHDYDYYIMDVAIIDEVDNMLIDSSNSEYTVSINSIVDEKLSEEYKKLIELAYNITKDFTYYELDYSLDDLEKYSAYADYDYIINHFSNTVLLTYKRLDLLNKVFGCKNFIHEYQLLYNFITSILYVKHFLRKDEDYAVYNDNICLINKYTGVLMPLSKYDVFIDNVLRYNNGLPIQVMQDTETTINFQTYTTLYNVAIGTSGTLYESEDEISNILGCDISIVEPFHKENTMIYPYKLFNSRKELLYWLEYELRDLLNPVLIIAKTDREASEIYDFIKKNRDISYKNLYKVTSITSDEETEDIISKAGEVGTITVATIKLGRGTDIRISSDAEFIGGLYVIQIGFHERESVNRQIMGRASRFGKRGKYVCLLDMSDDIFYFMTENEKAIINKSNDYDKIKSIYRRYYSQNYLYRTQQLDYDKFLYDVKKTFIKDLKYLNNKKSLIEVLYVIDKYSKDLGIDCVKMCNFSLYELIENCDMIISELTNKMLLSEQDIVRGILNSTQSIYFHEYLSLYNSYKNHYLLMRDLIGLSKLKVEIVKQFKLLSLTALTSSLIKYLNIIKKEEIINGKHND